MELDSTTVDDDEVGPGDFNGRGSRGSGRLKPSHLPVSGDDTSCPGDDSTRPKCYRPGEIIEARFGGRSRWFVGRIKRVSKTDSGGITYDIAYDDGDQEEGVVIGRVRRPGQAAPTLQAGLSMDVKLARKGPGYHPGVIGRVNDDGSLYIKFDNGDAEWSVPSQHAIARYAFVPRVESDTEHDVKFDCKGDVEKSSWTGGNASPRSGEAPPSDGQSSPTVPIPWATVETPRDRKSPERAFLDKSRRTRGDRDQDPDDAAAGLPSEDRPQDSGGGLDWIEEVAKTSAPSALPANVEAKPTRQASGLDWITELASSTAAGTAKRAPNEAGTAQSISIASGVLQKPAPTSLIPQSIAGLTLSNDMSTPTAGLGQTFRAKTPPHLEWKPACNAATSRRWGAPPPDEPAPVKAGGSSPPQLSSEAASAFRAVPAAMLTCPVLAPDGFRVGGQAVSEGAKGFDQGGDEAQAAAARVEDNRSGTEMQSALSVGQHQIGAVPHDMQADASRASAEEGAHARPDGPCAAPDSAKSSLSLEASVENHGNQAQGALPQLVGMKKASADTPVAVERGRAEDTGDGADDRWALRTTVQRRYAAEAMHLAEEVRLLKAKLRAMDSSMQQRLEQVQVLLHLPVCDLTTYTSDDMASKVHAAAAAAEQAHLCAGRRFLPVCERERDLRDEMKQTLECERARMVAALHEERSAATRRIRALTREANAAKGRLEHGSKRGTGSGGDRYVNLRHQASTPCPSCGRSTRLMTTGRTIPLPTRATKQLRGSRPSKDAQRASPSQSEGLGRLPPPPPLDETNDRGYQRRAAACRSPSKASPLTAEAFVSEEGGDNAELRHMMKSVMEGLASRDEIIRELAARLGDADAGGQRAIPPRGSTVGRAQSKQADALAQARRLSPSIEQQSSAALDTSSGGGSGVRRSSRDHQEGDAAQVSLSTGHAVTETRRIVEDGRERIAADRTAQRVSDQDEHLRWTLVKERRDSRKRLETLKGQVESIGRQFRARAERAEALVATAEERAMAKALRYLATKSGRADRSGT